MTSGAEPWCPAVGEGVVVFVNGWSGEQAQILTVVKVTRTEVRAKAGDRSVTRYKRPHLKPIGDPYGERLSPLTDANQERAAAIQMLGTVLHDMAALARVRCKGVPPETLRQIRDVLRKAHREAGL